jgi:opacity protein-like surface antigen
VEGDASFSDKDKYDYLASARARIGYAHGSYLFYATGGVAFAGYNGFSGIFANDGENGDSGTSPSLFPPSLGQGGDGGAGGSAGAVSNSDDLVGFVVGAGVDAKLTDRITLGLEGLYYGFDVDDKKVSGDSAFNGSDDADVFVLRSRISYSLTPEVEALK